MKSKKQIIIGIISAISLFILIIDSKTAITAATSGVELCIRTVIPSLFPFFIISHILTKSLNGVSIPLLSPITRLTGVPQGGEAILLLGLLGGYPVGAQSIEALHRAKQISPQDAKRLLGFCNNAGPSFVFGVLGSCFTKPEYLWALWLIHIVSALLVGILLPNKRNYQIEMQLQSTIRITDSLKSAIQTCALVCGWVVAFRIAIAFLQRWIFGIIHPLGVTTIIGAMELVNGCMQLQSIGCEGLRFCLCSALLAFGGLCVAMQTATVTERIGTGYYFPGKVMQTVFSFLMAYFYQIVCFDGINSYHLHPFKILSLLLITCLLYKLLFSNKKTVAFRADIVYNKQKTL